MRRNNEAVETAIKYIERFIGKPYRWGGDDPIQSFDCSGLAIEFLKAAGVLKETQDYTANELMTLFQAYKVGFPAKGTLVFYGRSKATHVGICLGEMFMLEAGGGGSTTNTPEEASEQNAYIRVRPIKRRKDILCYCDPFLLE